MLQIDDTTEGRTTGPLLRLRHAGRSPSLRQVDATAGRVTVIEMMMLVIRPDDRADQWSVAACGRMTTAPLSNIEAPHNDLPVSTTSSAYAGR